MKKSIGLILVGAMMVALFACAAPAPREYATAPASDEAAAPADEAPAPADEAPAVEEPAYDYEEAPATDVMPAPVAPADGGYQPPLFTDEPSTDVLDEAIAPATGETYNLIEENGTRPTDTDSMLTFSLKVDTASYTNAMRYIESWSEPPADAVRVEEFINYFNYDAPMEFGGDPLAVYTEVGKHPFDADKYMAFVRVKAEDVDKSELPSSSLTFLIDTSGSMDSYDKLPLLKEAFKLLADNLDGKDRVSIVTYAGSSEVLLDGVKGNNKLAIYPALRHLDAGGSTAGQEGIQLAYELAEKNFIEGGNNRIILATDGDFNVGIDNPDDLSRFIGSKRDNGIYLSTLGFGTGNLRDDMMETLAKDGDGNYSYINSVATAEKVLVDELGSNLFTIADDVKAQVEFNPANVASYKLIGYENRQLKNEDFDNDKKDAGEIGVGTDVVLLFELELAPELLEGANGGTKYGGGSTPKQVDFGEYGDELFEVRIRYKNPGEQESNLILQPVTFGNVASRTSSDFNFAASVAQFGNILRNDQGDMGMMEDVIVLAQENLGDDENGYREKHVDLMHLYMSLYGW